jgi:hypothetical protein
VRASPAIFGDFEGYDLTRRRGGTEENAEKKFREKKREFG